VNRSQPVTGDRTQSGARLKRENQEKCRHSAGVFFGGWVRWGGFCCVVQKNRQFEHRK
jgi:hypothetical protein